VSKPRIGEKAQAIIFRMHSHDKALLAKLLGDDGLSFQAWATACMDAYLRGDPGIIKAIKDWRTINAIPLELQKKYTLSHRERAQILDDLESPIDEE